MLIDTATTTIVKIKAVNCFQHSFIFVMLYACVLHSFVVEVRSLVF